jgi:transcriptional regulator with AAA-type ATPase domain
VKVSNDQEALLDRGGHPTLRELLSHLVFSPANGTLRLGNTRMVLQRTSFLSHLREEISQRHGRDEAMVLLMRLGFQAGVEDSKFVHSSWQHLDMGDAFTAGTRLHTVSGIVRVETVHNDFDFKKGKFSGEFLWHESAEASEHRKHYGDADAPVCWSLVGYASGYATNSLGKLIVYKETQCNAMGHRHCRVVGKPAEAWGEDDPTVQLFRKKIVPRVLDGIPARNNSAVKWGSPASEEVQNAPLDLESLTVLPVRAGLERAVRAGFPLLITGPSGSGKMVAARYAANQITGVGKSPDILNCSELDTEKLRAALTHRNSRAERGAKRACIILQDIELLSEATQAFLEVHLREAAREGDAFVIAITGKSLLGFGVSPNFRPVLRQLLTFSSVAMPQLLDRPDDLAPLSRGLIDRLAMRMRAPSKVVGPSAMSALSKLVFKENIAGLEALLARAFMALAENDEIDGRAIEEAWNLTSIIEGNVAKGEAISTLAEQALNCHGFELEELNQAIYALAVRRAEGNIAQAAKMLGISRAQLAYRLGS